MTRSQILVSFRRQKVWKNYWGQSFDIIHYQLGFYDSFGYVDSEKYRFCIGCMTRKGQIFHQLLANRVKNGHFWPFFVTKKIVTSFQRATKSKLWYTDIFFIPIIITWDLYIWKNSMVSTRSKYFDLQHFFSLDGRLTKNLKN